MKKESRLLPAARSVVRRRLGAQIHFHLRVFTTGPSRRALQQRTRKRVESVGSMAHIVVRSAHASFAELLEDIVVLNNLADHAESLLKHILDKHEL